MSTITKTKSREKSSSTFNIRSLTMIGMLSAIAVVLMLFEIPLGFLPSFYKIDLSEVPVLIGSFALGPVAGILIELIKILSNLLIDGTETAGIGELANFLIGCALVIPSSMIYFKKKTRKSAVLGLTAGTLLLIVTGSLLNAYLLLPTYAVAFHMPIDGLIAMGTAVNPAINSMTTFILLAVAPFNLIKGIVVSVITILLYKKLSPIIKGNHTA
ncbi:riboflavin transporter FmnP [Mobilisporobacter senegalensis]|uniref:Riboflavin transporter n=1 Tax=Mobilisporobacter senegalensis TaxID=1329262 RepID=A0A3N1XAA2_9FIRM|nr:ECF transporter S component [Mobilisporobacter senegalensis]ROR21902.1 riboflavin transporter FmnP [Mobilisporobacter senegalensis]